MASNFTAQGDTWVRFWLFLDLDNNEGSQWIADETQAPVLIHDRNLLTFSGADGTGTDTGPGIDQFWFEYNSSQSRTDAMPDLFAWFRNFVVLKDLSFAEARALVD